MVGSDRYRLTVRTPSTAHVVATTTLPGGTITCSGIFRAGRLVQVLRVTAATGAFAKASGTCSAAVAPRNPYGADTLDVFKLRVPNGEPS